MGPRLGFAYTITPKTVLRAGGGIFYSFKTVTSGNSMAKNAPFSGTLLTTNDANNFAAAKPISAGFPPDRPQLWPIPGTGFYYWPQDAKTSTMYEWNINLQRELPSNLVLSVAYVGGKGTYVDVVGLNINQAIPGPGAVVTRRPYPNLSDATGVVPWGNSIYNSLQTTVERRFGAVASPGAWTWAHSIDDTSGESSNSPIQDSRNLAAQRASSTFDVRHKLTISGNVRDAVRQRTALDERGFAAGAMGRRRMAAQHHRHIPHGPAVHADHADQQPEYRDGIAVPEPHRVRRAAVQPAHDRPLVRRFGLRRARASTSSATRAATSCMGREHARSTSRCSRASPSRKAGGSSSGRRRSTPSTLRSSIIRTRASASPESRVITSAGSPTVYQRTSRQIQLAVKLYF